MAENPILIVEEQDKENSPPPPHPTPPVPKRPAQPPVLIKSHPFKTTTENVLDFVYRKSFEECFITVTVYVF